MSDNKEIQATTPSEDIKVSDSSLATEDETKTEAQTARAIEQAEEAKLRARMPFMNRPASSVFLQKRLGKGQQKYFDSGDYQMAKQKSQKSRMPPGLAHSTGDAIPTPDSVPARKSSIIQGAKCPSTLS